MEILGTKYTIKSELLILIVTLSMIDDHFNNHKVLIRYWGFLNQI